MKVRVEGDAIIGVRGFPERDTSSLHTLDADRTALESSSIAALEK